VIFPPPAHSGGGYQITNSVRLRAAASAYFSRTFGAGGDRDKWWVLIPEKRSTLGATQYLFGSDTASADAVYFNSSDKICVDIAGTNRLISTRVFRDPAAWGAFLVVFDASNGTNDLKLRVYYIDNGFAEITAWDTNTRSAITAGTAKTTLNTAAAVIGKNPTAANSYFDGHLSHFHLGTWSGAQPTPASFGGTDSNGVWVFSGASSAYGTQGSKLDFKDAALTAGSNAGLGKDVSGNGNYWTTNNISVTAGVTYDSMVDTPTNNYATLNPIALGDATLSDANLTATSGSSAWVSRIGTLAISTGKFYAEGAGAVTTASTYVALGFRGMTNLANSEYPGSIATSYGVVINITIAFAYNNGSTTQNIVGSFSVTTPTMVAIDFDAGKLWLGCAGSWIGGGDPAAGITPTYTFSAGTQMVPHVGGYNSNIGFNAGQRPFTYTPPTGFKALCTANLPAVAITNPRKHFDPLLYTADTAGGKTMSGLQFQPDLVWIKNRNNAESHYLQDAVRGFGGAGTSKALSSNSTVAEYAVDANITFAVTSDGFMITDLNYNAGELYFNGRTYVAWNWKANGAGVSNTDGSITSTVSANQTAGFSIVAFQYTSAGNFTVGHGLGATAKLIIIFDRTTGGINHDVWHASLTSGNRLILNSTAAQAAGYFTGIPGATTFGMNSPSWGLTNGDNCVAYCFAEIPGYSKFGSYVGNGSADGPFVYCGFRPKYVLIKNTAAVDNWYLWDTVRDTYNMVIDYLLANSSQAETTSPGLDQLDITASGFKIRGTQAGVNGSGNTIIFAAFAEMPSGGSNVSPSPAR